MPAPLKDETKRDSRITLSVTKEIYDGVRGLAQITDTSINDFVNVILAKTVEENADLLEQYNNARKKLLSSIKVPVSNLIDNDTKKVVDTDDTQGEFDFS